MDISRRLDADDAGADKGGGGPGRAGFVRGCVGGRRVDGKVKGDAVRGGSGVDGERDGERRVWDKSGEVFLGGLGASRLGGWGGVEGGGWEGDGGKVRVGRGVLGRADVEVCVGSDDGERVFLEPVEGRLVLAGEVEKGDVVWDVVKGVDPCGEPTFVRDVGSGVPAGVVDTVVDGARFGEVESGSDLVDLDPVFRGGAESVDKGAVGCERVHGGLLEEAKLDLKVEDGGLFRVVDGECG